MQEIIVLVDYQGAFYCPHKGTSQATDLDRTAFFFKQEGVAQRVLHFEDVDFRASSYENVPMLYQSSQDRGLHYKSYIEDVLLGLHLQGARLIPDLFKFRAHHNKAFQEVLRDLGVFGAGAKSLCAHSFGTLEALAERASTLPYPAVIKAAAGDTGANVCLVRDQKEALKVARRISRTWKIRDHLDNFFLKWQKPGFQAKSTHRRKFIVQTYIPGLDFDFKILAFGDRYFAEVRGVRPGDFRASGSKVPRAWPTSISTAVLDFVDEIFKACDVPFASIDILFDGKQAYLGEIQFLRFGTKPLIQAPHYWHKGVDGWHTVAGTFDWEQELVRAISQFLKK
ncbi:MAG: hypothetical protein QNJ97_07000 [Myxococcota bacterium]|nr:hypothetical protein [Myxococcota bacterium]